MQDVLTKSQVQRNIAKELLRSANIREILSKYGEVCITGSYKYDLMYGPDIDIYVVCDNPRKASVEALQEFIEQRNFQKFQYGDFEKHKKENRPEAFILVLIKTINGERWEIEIWFDRKYPEHIRYTDTLIAERLTPENRKEILSLKQNRSEEGADKNKLTSFQIYERVLGKL